MFATICNNKAISDSQTLGRALLCAGLRLREGQRPELDLGPAAPLLPGAEASQPHATTSQSPAAAALLAFGIVCLPGIILVNQVKVNKIRTEICLDSLCHLWLRQSSNLDQFKLKPPLGYVTLEAYLTLLRLTILTCTQELWWTVTQTRAEEGNTPGTEVTRGA